VATTDLKLDEPGSLPRPGPVGRLVRLGLGILCLWYVYGLIQVSGNLIAADGSIQLVIWNGIIFGLFLVSYVVNIGFSRAWKKWPAVVSVAPLAIIAGVGYAMSGMIETNLLARSIWIWEMYVFSHLGLAFIVAGAIGTPRCELGLSSGFGVTALEPVWVLSEQCVPRPAQPADITERRGREGNHAPTLDITMPI
jgi:hypothetical protein